jgi:hypothetical protein
MKRLTLLALLYCTTLKADVLLTDSFDGSQIESTKWTAYRPQGGSQVFESGGNLVMQMRGGVDSVMTLPDELQIEGGFRFTGYEDHFAVVLRSDLSIANGYYEKTGIRVSFQDNSQTLRIQELGSGINNEIAFSFYTLNRNTDYTFKIVDQNNIVSLYLNGDSYPVIQATTFFRPGSFISFYDRENPGNETQLQYVSVSSVPEPSSLSLLLAGVTVLLARRRAKQ